MLKYNEITIISWFTATTMTTKNTQLTYTDPTGQKKFFGSVSEELQKISDKYRRGVYIRR